MTKYFLGKSLFSISKATYEQDCTMKKVCWYMSFKKKSLPMIFMVLSTSIFNTYLSKGVRNRILKSSLKFHKYTVWTVNDLLTGWFDSIKGYGSTQDVIDGPHCMYVHSMLDQILNNLDFILYRSNSWISHFSVFNWYVSTKNSRFISISVDSRNLDEIYRIDSICNRYFY